MAVVLSSAYLAPVAWYAALARHERCFLDAGEHYVKQTWRNRCRIAMPDGPADLVIPVESASSHAPMRDLRISDHGQWRHHHWNALRTAYGKSPFFEYYADDFAPFYHERRWPFLVDYCEALRATVCELIDLQPNLQRSDSYIASPADAGLPATATLTDLRNAFTPRQGAVAPAQQSPAQWCARPYYQVFSQQTGFLPNLSIVDLLFNLGPESLLYLDGSYE